MAVANRYNRRDSRASVQTNTERSYASVVESLRRLSDSKIRAKPERSLVLATSFRGSPVRRDLAL